MSRLSLKTFIPCLTLALIPMSSATPDRVITVTEHILGTSDTGFVIQRTEEDNVGSYYQIEVKHYLDTYEKVPRKDHEEYDSPLAKKVSSVLLLAQHLDSGKDLADFPMKVRKTEEGNKSTTLVDLIKHYPVHPMKWPEEKFSRLSSGAYIGNLSLIWGGRVKERLGFDRNADVEWELQAVVEDQNSLFLKVLSGKQQCWLCILPAKTQQVNAHLALEDFYLLAASYDAKDLALAEAKRLSETAKSHELYDFEFEVWSPTNNENNNRYLVVRPLTEASLRKGFSKLEELFRIDLKVVSSNRFEKRFWWD